MWKRILQFAISGEVHLHMAEDRHSRRGDVRLAQRKCFQLDDHVRATGPQAHLGRAFDKRRSGRRAIETTELDVRLRALEAKVETNEQGD
jgi:hypothetical protein